MAPTKSLRGPQISAYIVRHDTGFAPNPFGGVCTLACCKPLIRKNANPGDIIVGTASAHSDKRGRLIYAMKVDEVIPLENYWNRFPGKRPSNTSDKRRVGDNIWQKTKDGKAWKVAHGALHGMDKQATDTDGKNVLISRNFYYFGDNAIEIPERYNALLASTQGHKNTRDARVVEKFWHWLRKAYRRGGQIGMPIDFNQSCSKPQKACEKC